MKMKKLLIFLVLSLVICLAGGCGSSSTNGNTDGNDPQNSTETGTGTDNSLEKITLKFGTNANYIKIVEACTPLLEEKGYTVEIKTFDDPVSIDTATAEGSVDVNFYQHLPYMENFNASHDANLVMLEPYIVACRMGLASDKYDSLDKIPDGATIAIAQDASNKDRGLRLLNDNGLLTLSEQDDSYSYTTLDVVDNPKNLQFVEVDLYSMLKTMEDVDAAAFQCLYLITAGQTLDNILCFSKDDERYPCGIVVDEKYKDTQWAKDLMEVFTSDVAKEAYATYWQESMKVLF